jgi:hypothetical protein
MTVCSENISNLKNIADNLISVKHNLVTSKNIAIGRIAALNRLRKQCLKTVVDYFQFSSVLLKGRA